MFCLLSRLWLSPRESQWRTVSVSMAELNPINIPVLAYKGFAYWTCCLCHYYYSPVLWQWQLLYACVMPVLCLAYIRILTVNTLTAPNPSVPNSFLNGLNLTLLAFQCVSDLLSLLLWFIFANIPWKDDWYSMLSNDVYTWQILHILRGWRYRKELTILYYTCVGGLPDVCRWCEGQCTRGIR